MMLKILTLSWNGSSKLSTLYPSLMNATNGIDYEWWIKDNGSSDDTHSLVESWNNDKVKLVKHPNNLDSFALGCNRLFKMSEPTDDDNVLLLNNDVIFNDKYSLKNMLNILKDESVGVVGAKLTYPKTNKIQHAGVVFEPSHRMPIHFRANEADDINASKNREFQAITGAVFLTKSSLYKQICTTNRSGFPGQDEKLVWAFDDVCACLAIKYKMNKKIVYCGQTNISHEESATLKLNPVNHMFMSQNQIYVYDTWGSTYQIDAHLYRKDIKYNLYKGSNG
jgi:O-antigen biosynthesis protein